ncbi:MAG TPA: RNA 2',3'-cyclic phosphodiesterase [Nitrososphaerales archaeon]
MRAFIAVDLNDETVKRNLEDLQRALESSGAHLKSVKPSNLHFTIRFLGEISEEESRNVINIMKDLDISSFRISFKGLGYFPDLSRISVVWVGVDEGKNELARLAEQVEIRIRSLGFKPEKKFVPHLTICRVRNELNKDLIINASKPYVNNLFGETFVDSIKLKKSTLSTDGPIYNDIFTLHLGMKT